MKALLGDFARKKMRPNLRPNLGARPILRREIHFAYIFEATRQIRSKNRVRLFPFLCENSIYDCKKLPLFDVPVLLLE